MSIYTYISLETIKVVNTLKQSEDLKKEMK